MLDWDSFRIMLKIAQEGSLSAAARSLEINQATVGRKLQRAEEQLNAKLFYRMSNGLFPTEAGVAALTSAKEIEENISALTKELRGNTMAEYGNIRLSLPRGLLGPEFNAHLSDFCIQTPEITFELTTKTGRVSFEERDLDVAIIADNQPSSGLWGFRLTQLRYCYAASSSFMKLWGPRLSEGGKSAEVPLVDWSLGKGDACAQLMRTTHPKAIEVLSSDTLEGVLPLVENGVGIGRALSHTVEQRDDLVKVLDCGDIGATDLWVLTHQDYRDTPRIRKFMEYMRDSFKPTKGNLRAVAS